MQIQISWLLQIYTVCKGRVYPVSARQGLKWLTNFRKKAKDKKLYDNDDVDDDDGDDDDGHHHHHPHHQQQHHQQHHHHQCDEFEL